MTKFQGSKKDVAKLTSLSERKIHFYTDYGLVVPEISNPSGKGTTRLYSFENLVDFLLVRELIKLGFNLKSIKLIMDKVRGINRRRWFTKLDESRFYLVVYNLNTERLAIEMEAHEDPETIRRMYSRQGISPEKIERKIAKLRNIKLNIFDKDSALVVSLSKLSKEAASLV